MDLLELVRERYAGFNKKFVNKEYVTYKGECPDCGGDKTTTRFCIYFDTKSKDDKGHYRCWNCDIHGDAIQYCRDILNLSFKEALEKLDLPAPENSRSSSCKYEKTRSFNKLKSPPELWLKSAAQFVSYCHEHIFAFPQTISMLRERGLPIEAIKQYKFGINPTPIKSDLKHWGAEYTTDLDGKKITYLSLRAGLVIPSFVDDKVVRINIRRPDWESSLKKYIYKTRDGDDPPKYKKVRGCMNGYNILGKISSPVMLVVESELDAFALHYACSDFAMVLAGSGNNHDPDNVSDLLARNMSHLLICHDNDEAGLAMLKKWTELYPHAKAYPTPTGKDIGEFVQNGGNLREWVLAALPDDFNYK